MYVLNACVVRMHLVVSFYIINKLHNQYVQSIRFYHHFPYHIFQMVFIVEIFNAHGIYL